MEINQIIKNKIGGNLYIMKKISKKVSFAGSYITYESDDSFIYIIQLAQSRLFEAYMIDYVKVYKYRENLPIFIASKSLLCE